MSNEKSITLQQAVELIFPGMIPTFGFHKTYFAELPEEDPNELGWFDLSDGDHNAVVDDDVLYLELWYRGSFTEPAVIGRRTLSLANMDVPQVKIKMAVATVDIAYLHMDQERYWVEGTTALLIPRDARR